MLSQALASESPMVVESLLIEGASPSLAFLASQMPVISASGVMLPLEFALRCENNAQEKMNLLVKYGAKPIKRLFSVLCPHNIDQV